MGAANTHLDQLTLAEFSAIRTRTLVQNPDMIAIARTVQLTDEGKTNDAEHDNDNGNDRDKNANRMQSEFMGGEHDADDEAGIDEEELLQNAPKPICETQPGRCEEHFAARSRDCRCEQERPPPRR